MNKKNILDFLSSHKSELKEKFDVNQIGLFGSYAKGMRTPESDIDIYVESAKNSFDDLTGLYLYLERHLNKKIDIIHRHRNNNPSLKDNIGKLKKRL